MKKSLLLVCLVFLVVAKTFAQPISVTKNSLPMNRAELVSSLFEEQTLRQKMKEDGLTEPVINRIIEGRKKLEAQGRKVQWSHHERGGSNPTPSATCTDIGVENGWASWLGATGSNSGGNPAALGPPTVPTPPRFNITSGAGIDPCTPGVAPGAPPLAVVAPGFGNASIQLGEPQATGCMVEQLTYPLMVTAADTDFVYTYAMVLYDPVSGHQPQEKPFADFLILDQFGDTVPCSFVHYISNPAMPGWYSANATCVGGQDTYYKPWTTVGVNLKNYVGQNLTVVITNGDCVFCGHFAHSYWDFKCGSIPLGGCNGSASTVCGPASDPGNPNTYQWYKNGIMMPGGTNQCQAITPNSGDTYVVQVMPASGCSFNMTYVAATGTLQSLFTYTTSASTVQFADLSTAATQWSWNFGDGNTSTSQNPSHTYTSPGTYTACLAVTDGVCHDTVCKTVSITAVGLNEYDLSSGITLFPSPASKQVFLDFSGKNFGQAEFSVSNILGDKIHEATILASGVQVLLDVSGFSDGIYFVKIKTMGGSVVKKIVVSNQ